jgi:hypothetical protein
MTPSRAASAASLVLAAALALASCGDDADGSNADAPDLGGSSEPSATPEPTESESPNGPEGIPTSFPEVGLEYVDFPEPTKETRPALEVFVAFDTGRAKLLRKAAMNDQVRNNAAEAVVAQYQGTVDYLQSHNAVYRGETVATVTDVVTKDNFVALDLCTDGTALRFVENGKPGPVDGPSRVPFRVIITRTDTGWTVTEASSQEGSC